MASNLSEISQAIENLNVTFSEINTSSLLSTAIQETNNNSGGWIGLIIFIIMSASIVLHLIKNKQNFALFDDFNLFYVGLAIILDFSLFLIIWGILDNYYIFVFTYCIFIVLAFISLLKKDLLTPEQ